MFYTFLKEITPPAESQLSLFSRISWNPTKQTHIITTQIHIPTQNMHTKAVEKEEEFIKLATAILKNAPTPTETMQEYYTSFKIPKKTGGFREISAPNDSLKYTQWCISKLLSYNLSLLTHEAAYAYIPKRSHIDALKKHQANNSKWFLKLDIKNFFPSCTKEFVQNQLRKLYPIAVWGPTALDLLDQLINLCCLNGALPQGSPASPILSNLIFIPFDWAIQDSLQHIFNTRKYVYTRYADDICISAKGAFSYTDIATRVQKILAPEFTLKNEKMRYGSTAGRNWNLGLMLNKDNQITTGAVNKRNIKAMLCNFIIAEKENKPYTLPQVQRLQGILNYAKQIEPEYISYLIDKYTQKYNFPILSTIQQRLKTGIR